MFELPRRLRTPLLVAAWLTVVAAFALVVAQSQDRSREVLEQRQEVRASMSARFISAYVADLAAHERRGAIRHLADRRVGEEQFQRAAAAMGFANALLLDRRGRVLRVAPARPDLIGTDVTGRYAHLARATAGRVAVSDVVPAAARGNPVVAFAVPFPSAAGPRVFSGAQDVARTPLGAYLRSTAVVGARVWLIDSRGRVIAQNAPPRRGAEGEELVMRRAIAGTPWRLVMRVPERLLYAPIESKSRWMPWVAVGALGVVGLAVVLLISWLLAGRARLAELNRRLDRLSRIDNLTGLYNQRQMDELLAGGISAAQRHGMGLAVLVVDVDHFKRVNDRHGHQVGDEVLRHVAATLRLAVRAEDALGRWGGEEFLGVLPGADEDAARATAERLRRVVSATPCPIPGQEPISVTVTIGVAVWDGESASDLVREADTALYAGKAAGRDVVRV